MFELGKSYKTRDGRWARIICVDREGKDSIIALIPFDKEGHEGIYAYNANGRSFDDYQSESDLMPPKIKRTVYINVYSDTMTIHDKKHHAESFRGSNCIAYLERDIEYYEGEGLEDSHGAQ